MLRFVCMREVSTVVLYSASARLLKKRTHEEQPEKHVLAGLLPACSQAGIIHVIILEWLVGSFQLPRVYMPFIAVCSSSCISEVAMQTDTRRCKNILLHGMVEFELSTCSL